MSDNYEPIIYTLTDEEGKSQQFEMLDSMEVNDQLYCAMIPYYDSEQDVASDYGELIILKVVYDRDDGLKSKTYISAKQWDEFIKQMNQLVNDTRVATSSTSEA